MTQTPQTGQQRLNDQLITAVKAGSLSDAKNLLHLGADLYGCNDSFDMAPLSWACVLNNPAMVKLLIDNGADIQASRDKFGTPLHAACSSHVDDPSVVSLLVDLGAEIEATRKRESGVETPLIRAVRGSNPKIALFLMTKLGLTPEDKYEHKTLLEHFHKNGPAILTVTAAIRRRRAAVMAGHLNEAMGGAPNETPSSPLRSGISL
jgi:ankyrin repeat protein